MTKNQEIITRQLVDRACNARDSKGQRTIDFIPNAYRVMEDIVLTWERGEHTSANFKAFKRLMADFIEALHADEIEYLKLDTFDKAGSSLWQTALTVSVSHGWGGDRFKKSLHLDDAVYSLLDACPDFTRLLITHRGILSEYMLLEESSPLPKLARTGEAGRYTSLDNLEKAMRLCGFSYVSACALAGLRENDFLKLHIYRKEVK